MTKKAETKEILQWLSDSISDTMDGLWAKHCQHFDFSCDEDYAPYGDTFVSTGSYITDESDHECREAFEQNLSVDTLIEELKVSKDFRDCLAELIETWAYEKELEV